MSAVKAMSHPLVILLCCAMCAPAAMIAGSPAANSLGWFFLGFGASSFITSIGDYAIAKRSGRTK